MDPQEFDAWFAEYHRLSDALDPYSRAILSKGGSWGGGYGKQLPLTEMEERFDRLCYYWLNGCDLFNYMDSIVYCEAHVKAIGATRTLDAMHQLLPYYEEYRELKTTEKQAEYGAGKWHLIEAIAMQAEDVLEFGRLLLAFAEKNLEYLKHEDEE